MNLLYAVDSTEVRFGSAPAGLTSTIPLSFAGYRIVALPGQRFLYVTGSKGMNGQIHAYLAVIDTCSNTVISELDLGIGFAGQCAVPDVLLGIRAFVAISQAFGATDTAPQGSNRVEVLDISNPAAPMRMANSAIHPIGYNQSYGFLHIVWAHILDRVYVSHRGDSVIYFFDAAILQASLQHFPLANVISQPTGLGISRDGQTLFVVGRANGDLLQVDLQPLHINPPLRLVPDASSGSSLYIAVSRRDQVLITSSRPDGNIYLFQHQRPPAAMPQNNALNVGGDHFGQPAFGPDEAVLYIPRATQNDIAQVTVQPLATIPGALATGIAPTDLVVLDHDAGMTLRATTISTAATCNQGANIITVKVDAIDSCGKVLKGIQIRASVGALNISVSPVVTVPTPATFRVTCNHGGAASVNFIALVPFSPPPAVSVNVQCQCPQLQCFDFTAFLAGPAPLFGTFAGRFDMEIALQIPPIEVPVIFRSWLRLFGGGVRFTVQQGTVDNLTVHLRRDSPAPPVQPIDRVDVWHGTDISTVFAPGLDRGSFDLACSFTGITQFEIYGGIESAITSICFEA